MSTDRTCPGCHAPLGSRAKYCPCGWSQADDETPGWPPSCQYTNGQTRCRYPASIRHGTNGSGAAYCRQHWRVLDAPTAALVCEESRDYRAPIREQIEAEFLARVHASIERAGLTRRQAEPERDWLARLRAFCFQGMRQMSRTGGDRRAWARRIVDAHIDASEWVGDHQLQLACEALGYEYAEIRRLRGER